MQNRTMTSRAETSRRPHKSFALVLSGGGARGLSHAGVLKSLITKGYIPSAIVGVSMGAVVASTYALNDNWYDELVEMDTSGFPATPDFRLPGLIARLRGLRIAMLAARDMYFGWGVGARTETWGRNVLTDLTKGKELQDGRIPIFVCATDMLSGQRVVFDKGPATDCVYSSAALAGILPPLVHGDHILMDGAYADIAPVDVARAAGVEVVIAVDPSQRENATGPKNGLQAMMRSIEVCQHEHARLRFAQADLVIRPAFTQTIGTLEFRLKRHCIAAGAVAARRAHADIAKLLDPDVGGHSTGT